MMSTCHSSLITQVPSLNSIHVTPIENQTIFSKAQRRFLSLSPGSEESYWRFNYSPQELWDEAECVMSAALKPCDSIAGNQSTLFPSFPPHPSLLVKFLYPGSILCDPEKRAVEVNKEFIKDWSKMSLCESCADGHGLLGHVWSTRIMSSCCKGNNCTVECDTVWSYHSRIKVKPVLCDFKDQWTAFCLW